MTAIVIMIPYPMNCPRTEYEKLRILMQKWLSVCFCFLECSLPLGTIYLVSGDNSVVIFWDTETSECNSDCHRKCFNQREIAFHSFIADVLRNFLRSKNRK